MISNKKVPNWKRLNNTYRVGTEPPAFISHSRNFWMSLKAPIEMNHTIYKHICDIECPTLEVLFRKTFTTEYGYSEGKAYSFITNVLNLKVQSSALFAERLKEIGRDAYIVNDLPNDDIPSEEDLYWGVVFDGEHWRGRNELGNLWFLLRSNALFEEDKTYRVWC